MKKKQLHREKKWESSFARIRKVGGQGGRASWTGKSPSILRSCELGIAGSGVSVTAQAPDSGPKKVWSTQAITVFYVPSLRNSTYKFCSSNFRCYQQLTMLTYHTLIVPAIDQQFVSPPDLYVKNLTLVFGIGRRGFWKVIRSLGKPL